MQARGNCSPDRVQQGDATCAAGQLTLPVHSYSKALFYLSLYHLERIKPNGNISHLKCTSHYRNNLQKKYIKKVSFLRNKRIQVRKSISMPLLATKSLQSAFK